MKGNDKKQNFFHQRNRFICVFFVAGCLFLHMGNVQTWGAEKKLSLEVSKTLGEFREQSYEEIAAVFVQVYALQERIEYNEKRLDESDVLIAKSAMRKRFGLGNKSEAEIMENRKSSIERTIIADKSEFEVQKKKLSELLGINVVIGYEFENPLITKEFDRKKLSRLMAGRDISEETQRYINDMFETYVAARKECEALKKERSELSEDLKRAKVLHMMNRLSYFEYVTMQNDLEEIELRLIWQKAECSKELYLLDSQLNGEVLATISEKTVSANDGSYSYVVEEEADSVGYYIHEPVYEDVYEFGLTDLAGAENKLTHYELWVEGVQIGSRTKKDEAVKFVSLDLKETQKVFVRLYKKDTVVADCEINPKVLNGRISFISDYSVETVEDHQVGSYLLETNAYGMVSITIMPDRDEKCVYYNVMTGEGVYLISEDKKKVTQTFQYLGLAKSGLSGLVVNFYDEEENFMYKARFQISDQTLQKIVPD